MDKPPFVLGIAGGSGSGKSTLADRLIKSEYSNDITLLAHDAYYLNGHQMPEIIQASQNWDHPEALDNELFIKHLDLLKAGIAVEQPIYDFSTHSRRAETKHIVPKRVIIVEGILLLALKEIRERIDLRIFADTPADERIVRRMLRDVAERGRTIDSVANQLRSTVRPMHEQFVEPSRAHAHVVIPCNGDVDYRPALNLILAKIKMELSLNS